MFPSSTVVKAQRVALERLYRDTAIVTVKENGEPDSKTGRIIQREVSSESFPCRLSYKTIPEASQTEGVATYRQTVKLFCAPEITIPAGSWITVTHLGHTLFFTASGVPAVYGAHQEISLEHKDLHDG